MAPYYNISFTSLALEGVHNRLSLFKVLTQSHGPGTYEINAGQPTTDKPINNYHRLYKPHVEMLRKMYIMYYSLLTSIIGDVPRSIIHVRYNLSIIYSRA